MGFNLSDKGGMSVYDLGRFPVTLYYEQWIRLEDKAQNLRQFLEEKQIKTKGITMSVIAELRDRLD